MHALPWCAAASQEVESGKAELEAARATLAALEEAHSKKQEKASRVGCGAMVWWISWRGARGSTQQETREGLIEGRAALWWMAFFSRFLEMPRGVNHARA